jgi:hypothetical protein
MAGIGVMNGEKSRRRIKQYRRSWRRMEMAKAAWKYQSSEK